ncbi:hypothetical protein Sm713_08920 [Streptomyces sp. TS71-3]|nr:hypothetical protein Sm713_08920 [Streptomyces sp. TS71-3]
MVAGELTEWERLVFGDLRHADVPEALPGGPLDVLENGQFVQVHGSDAHGRILHDTPDDITDQPDDATGQEGVPAGLGLPAQRRWTAIAGVT